MKIKKNSNSTVQPNSGLKQSLFASHRFIIFILCCVGVLVYANSLNNQLFWDDDDFIIKNRFIKDWKYFPQFFTENVIAGNDLLSNYWRPVLLILFSIEWHLWQDWPAGYHAVSILYHSAVSVLIYLVIFKLFKRQWLAFLTSLFFLVHPVHTEVVVYANAISDSLASFFIFLSLFFFLKSKETETKPQSIFLYWLCFLMYPFALMSKETGFMLPAYIGVINLLFFSTNKPLFKRIKDTAIQLIPFILVGIVYLILRATTLNFINSFNFYTEENLFTSNIIIRLLTFFRVLSVYLGLMVIPYDLRVERTVDLADSLFSFSVLTGLGFAFTLIFLSWRTRKTNLLVAFATSWFFLSLFPSSNLLIPINALLYEHFIYLPIMGFILIVVDYMLRVYKQINKPVVLISLAGLYFLFLCITTVNRNTQWKNAIVFYENLLHHAPNSYRVINNLGMLYAEQKNYPKAEELYLKAIEIDPQNPVGHHNLAGTFRDTGRIELATHHFKHALSLNPKFLFSHRSLAKLYIDQKKYPEAQTLLENYLSLIKERETQIDILILLSQLAFEQKNLNAARYYFEKILTIDPNNKTALNNLANLNKH